MRYCFIENYISSRNKKIKIKGIDVLVPKRAYIKVKRYNGKKIPFKSNSFDVVIYSSNIGGTRNTTHLSNVALTNLRIFFNILRCKKMYGRMIFLGSGAEYNKNRPYKHGKER
mgnify:CR=1 FL=1